MGEKNFSILQINVGTRVFGGVEMFLLNVYQNIDREKYKFTFATTGKSTYKLYKNELQNLGGDIVEFNCFGNLLTLRIRQATSLNKFLSYHSFDIIHINTGDFIYQAMALLISYRHKIPVRIAHSHSVKNDRQLAKKICAKAIEKLGTHYLACSLGAAKSMFSKAIIKNHKYTIVKNGIFVEEFIFNEEKRVGIRKKWNLNDELVILHIGGFKDMKNHDFILTIYKKLSQMESNSCLWLVGEGELKKEIEEKTKELNLSNKIKFLGERKDIKDLLLASDVFLLPSKYEGLGIVAIEAQAADLPIICSDNVPLETKVTDKIKYYSLKDSVDVWVDAILSFKNTTRYNTKKIMTASGYDINTTVAQLCKLYDDSTGRIT